MQVEKIARRATRRWRRSWARRACARTLRRRGARACSTSSCEHGRAVRAERARAAAAGEAPDFVPLVRAWGGVSLAYRKRLRGLAGLPPEPRGGRSRRSRRASRFVENLEPDRGGARRVRRTCKAMRVPARAAGGRDGRRRRRRRAAGAHGAGGRRHVAEHHLREGAPGHVPARRASSSSSSRTAPARTATAALPPRAGPGRLLHVVRRTTAGSSRYYGDNHPRYAGNVVKAMASAKHGYPHVVGAVRRTSSRALDPAAQPARDARVARAGRARSTTS